MKDSPLLTQRDLMRLLFVRYKDDEAAIVAAYVTAEREGKVRRERDANALSSEEYARRLFRDGKQKRWLWTG